MRIHRRPPTPPHSVSGAALLLLTVLILLSGCAPAWPFPQPTQDPHPKLPDSQQIFQPLEIGPNAGDLATLDPALINFGVDYDKAQLIFPGLVTLDEQNKVVDWAAERHEVSADGLAYTFHLRTGMQWSDGTPIDANTFAYSINRALDPCTGSSVASYLYNIKGAAQFNGGRCPSGARVSVSTLIGKSIVVADPLTLTLALEAPAGYFLASLTYPTSFAVPRALIEQYADKWTEHLADNGGFGGNLFKLTKWDHQGHLDFERNERFWGQKPLLRRLDYTLYRDTDGLWSDYKGGKGDTGYPVPAEIANARSLKGSTFHQVPQLAFSYLVPNWSVAPFDDVRVRNAFSLALDRQAIAHDILKDTAQPTIHLVPEGIPGYSADLADAAGRRGKDALTADLTTARRLATAYAAEKCGGDMSKCPPVVVTIRATRPNTALVIQTMQRQWQTAFPGWPITVGSIEMWLTPRSLRLLRNVQFRNDAWGADYPDPQDFLSLLWTTTNDPNAYNQSGVSIPNVDTLCAQADGMSNLDARIPLYQRAEQLLVDQAAAIPFAQSLRTYVTRPRIMDWSIASSGQTPLSVWQATYVTK